MLNAASSDLLQPFQLDASNLRGRLVRLGPALTAILSRHTYPDCVAQLLAETLALTTLLAGMLKYDGVFTLQAQGSGAVRLLVADVDHHGAVRAYARFDPESLAQLPPDRRTAHDLLESGMLAFTVDQGDSGERYQGVVELEGQTLADFARAYFRRSEQIDTAFSLAVSRDPVQGWQAGGLMLQRLPEQASPVAAHTEDDWRRTMMLMATLTPGELTDPDLLPRDLLFRLFHEETVRVYPPQDLVDQCRCSAARVATVLRALPAAEQAEIMSQGAAEVRCEFCSRIYRIAREDPGQQVH